MQWNATLCLLIVWWHYVTWMSMCQASNTKPFIVCKWLFIRDIKYTIYTIREWSWSNRGQMYVQSNETFHVTWRVFNQENILDTKMSAFLHKILLWSKMWKWLQQIISKETALEGVRSSVLFKKEVGGQRSSGLIKSDGKCFPMSLHNK